MQFATKIPDNIFFLIGKGDFRINLIGQIQLTELTPEFTAIINRPNDNSIHAGGIIYSPDTDSTGGFIEVISFLDSAETFLLALHANIYRGVFLLLFF